MAAIRTNMKIKDTNVFPNIIHVVGTYVYDVLSSFLKQCG